MTPRRAENDRDAEALRLDRQACFPLYAAANLITRIYAPLLATIGLTYPQYLVMLVLWESEPLHVGALGARLYLDSGTLTPLLKRLEAADLVSRARDPRDERRVLISLTRRGRALRSAAARIPRALREDPDLTRLGDLRECLQALVQDLGEHDGAKG